MGKIIAVLVIMIVINLFMIFALKKAAIRADMTIRKYFMNTMGDMDIACAAQSGEEAVSLEESHITYPHEEEPMSEKANKSNLPAMRSDKKSVINYKNIDFKREYKMVKLKMTLSKKDIISEVINHENIITDSSISKIVENIRNRFNFDMIYNLSTLSQEQQLSVLRETLLSSEQHILDKFLAEECENGFDCIEFFNYIYQLSVIYDLHYYVITGWESDNFENLQDGIVTIYDSNICEGIKIVHQNRLYDYSI